MTYLELGLAACQDMIEKHGLLRAGLNSSIGGGGVGSVVLRHPESSVKTRNDVL